MGLALMEVLGAVTSFTFCFRSRFSPFYSDGDMSRSAILHDDYS